MFIETAGWERPNWYASNEGLLERYAGRLMEREAEWEARWWSPIINAEHLAMRDACGIVDLTAFAVFDITGPGALAAVQSIAVAQMDVRVGRVVYTSLLDERGGFRGDLTIMRLGPQRFRVVTGGATGMMDLKWFADHLQAGAGSAAITDLTSAWTTLGLWGPRARDVLASVTDDDVSHAGLQVRDLPGDRARRRDRARLAHLLRRRARLGAVRADRGGRAGSGTRSGTPGSPHGLVPVGIGVYGTTGRLEKGYRAFGAELDSSYTIVEAGMARPSVKEQPFLGREAYLEQRSAPPCAVLCTLTVDDHRSSSGQLRYMMGGEPILTQAGEPLTDAKGRPSYVTSAGSGPSVGKHLLMAYLPPEQAVAGHPARRWSTWASRTRSRWPWPARPRCSTRRTSGSGADRHGDPGLRQARPAWSAARSW